VRLIRHGDQPFFALFLDLDIDGVTESNETVKVLGQGWIVPLRVLFY